MNIKAFNKDDFQHIMLRTELEQELLQIINNIRSGTNKTNQALRSAIDALKVASDNKTSFTDVNEVFELYKKIQSVSLELRKLISIKAEQENYNTIDYAFYIAGKRYTAQTLSPEWLTVSPAGLFVRLGRVKIDMDQRLKDLKNQAASLVRDDFAKHYELYANAISGMYKRKPGEQQQELGTKGSRLNYGHVAEGYERHLQDHRQEYYDILNSLDTSQNPDENLIKRAQAITNNFSKLSQWSPDEEDPTEAWIHIRESVGNQRGTAAGDVYSRQVKQTQKNSGNLRLSSLENLKEGVEVYSIITDTSKSPEEVAHRIALYLEDVLQTDDIDKEAQAEIANRAFGNYFADLSKERFVKI